ncbi:MAG: single-stranded DNA-binding protein [Chloroflexi bacterium]|nr:single-stranded DNA-binding protein [Chloroflexota bacterium]
MAISRKNRAGEKQTLWVRVNCWNRLSEMASQFVKKGSLIQASSEVAAREAWVDQSGTAQAESRHGCQPPRPA